MAIEITELISQLPVVFSYVQIFGYIVLALFFGATALKGWKGFLAWYLKWPFRLGAGFVCLVVGISIADYIPTLSTGIFRLLQSHILAAGIVASIIMGIAFYLISVKLPSTAESYRREVQRLQNKLNKMKAVKPDKVFTIAGIVIIAALIVFAAVNWKGFPPNIADELFSSIIPEGGLPGGITLGPGMSRLNPECLSIITMMGTITQEHPELLQNLQPFDNPTLKATIEGQSGMVVLEMYRVEYEGQRMILTIMDNDQKCISTETEFCACSE